jgi:hypothetical protein
MPDKSAYHVFYLPSDEAGVIPDHIVSVIQSDDPRDVALEQSGFPGTIAMLLDSKSADEVPFELTFLGFSY